MKTVPERTYLHALNLLEGCDASRFGAFSLWERAPESLMDPRAAFPL
jgi:hypothetical protein